MSADVVVLVTDGANTGKKVDCFSLTVGANTVYRQVMCIGDTTTGTSVANVAATNAALSETAAGNLRTASVLFAQDTAAGAGSQMVSAQVQSTATPNLRVAIYSGANLATVKAASTPAALTDPSLSVSLNPNNNAQLSCQFNAWATLPVTATTTYGAIQSDGSGNLKVGVVPLGTPIYGTASGGAQSNNVTLTIPSAKMGYFDGFDLDGLGATSGSAISVTVAGLLGGTLTFSIGIPAGITVPFTLSKRFNPPLQCSAVATNIVLTVPSYGTGNTAASVNAYGRYI